MQPTSIENLRQGASRLRRAALLAASALLFAHAATAAPPTASAPAAPPAAEAPEDEAPANEVVVTGRRKAPPPPGAVVGDIKPEESLSPADIQSYGVSTVTELLQELSPETRSDRGRGGESPVVLLNGRRISGFNEIQNIPTEAILRVDILPEEVSLKYGYSANQRVVNIVLRRRFRAITGEGQLGGPTEGGQVSGQAEADLLHILRDDRLNLDFKYSASSNLLESDRDLTSIASGEPYDALGNITAPVSGAEVDPALSALKGQPVTVVGAPAAAATRALGLMDYLAGANTANVTDVGRDRTLLPATQSVTANAVLARTLPFGVSGTGNLTLGATTSDTFQGLAGFPLTLSPGDPFSPFGEPVVVDRYATALGPLRQSVDGWTAHLGSTLNRDVGEWRLSLTDAYDHADSITDTQAGVDPAALQAQLDALSPTLNPFAPLAASSLVRLPEQRARSISDGANVQVLGNGPVLDVAAGQLYASVKFGDTESLLDTSSERGAVDQALSLSRNDVNAQLNLDLPLTSRDEHVLAFVGDLSVNVNAAVDELSDFGALRTLGYGLNWTPLTGVNFIVSRTQDQAAPTQAQLGAPTTLTPGVRTFDYLTGRTVDVTQVNGGTQGLVADNRSVVKVGLTWKPIATQQLSITANYIDSRIRNPIETFPAATAEIEAAFPDRFTRDASGELVQVDERPLNFAEQDRSEIRYGFDYSRPIGPQPQSRFPRGGRPRDGGSGGGRGGGGYGGWRRSRWGRRRSRRRLRRGRRRGRVPPPRRTAPDRRLPHRALQRPHAGAPGRPGVRPPKRLGGRQHRRGAAPGGGGPARLHLRRLRRAPLGRLEERHLRARRAGLAHRRPRLLRHRHDQPAAVRQRRADAVDGAGASPAARGAADALGGQPVRPADHRARRPGRHTLDLPVRLPGPRRPHRALQPAQTLLLKTPTAGRKKAAPLGAA